MGSLRHRQHDLSQVLRDYEERFQALETAARAGHTSIGGDSGALNVRNTANTPVVNIGTQSNGTNHGIEILPGGVHSVTNASGVQVVNIGTLAHSSGQGMEVSTDGSGNSGSFVNVGTTLASSSSSISTMQGQISTLQGQISTLQGQLSDLQNQINNKSNTSHIHYSSQVFTNGVDGQQNLTAILQNDLQYLWNNRNAP